ncbi:uncharacterized protein MELLADRAFT_114394 [Melampsora larici-populina 98AG31]|uniref:Uncharacterized protein n=1 Tax=Melampsora larici-populina (strain 98AG31 / pathotype 3-4-7) TaxID=747676 RepID=F4SDA4_MELLP|nr:uncharacterized protein MELLADRAFT_114394 [Melampsora larici-populina 98AG31]EGF97375.1 hypothetical protein MELLADRAFT_114394 [Melampsora larici-populina 98AG31]
MSDHTPRDDSLTSTYHGPETLSIRFNGPILLGTIRSHSSTTHELYNIGIYPHGNRRLVTGFELRVENDLALDYQSAMVPGVYHCDGIIVRSADSQRNHISTNLSGLSAMDDVRPRSLEWDHLTGINATGRVISDNAIPNPYGTDAWRMLLLQHCEWDASALVHTQFEAQYLYQVHTSTLCGSGHLRGTLIHLRGRYLARGIPQGRG